LDIDVGDEDIRDEVRELPSFMGMTAVRVALDKEESNRG
jgi:hypothetical protein